MSNNSAGFELEQTVRVELDLHLIILRRRLTEMMLETQREINSCGFTEIPGTDLIAVRKIVKFRGRLRADDEIKQRQHVLQRTAKFLKLHRLLEAGLTECYDTLVEYTKELWLQTKSEDNSTSALAREITCDSGFLKVQKIGFGGTGKNAYEHPKVKALIAQCLNLKLLKRQGIIFVGNKLLGETLANKLNACGLRTVTLMGAHAGNQTAHNYASQRFLSGQADFLICTSVLESQNYPQLQAGGIICYTLPQTPKSKQARQAHAAKNELAFISNLVASHSPDGSFWLLKRQIRQETSQATCPVVQMNLPI